MRKKQHSEREIKQNVKRCCQRVTSLILSRKGTKVWNVIEGIPLGGGGINVFSDHVGSGAYKTNKSQKFK